MGNLSPSQTLGEVPLSLLCPLCNGMKQLDIKCLQCHTEVTDCGRYDEYLGPYSPYRQIDDMKLTNGFNDLKNHQCIHVGYCAHCHLTFNVSVNEWREE